MLRDRGYFGAKAEGVDFTMKRKTTEKHLGEFDKDGTYAVGVVSKL